MASSSAAAERRLKLLGNHLNSASGFLQFQGCRSFEYAPVDSGDRTSLAEFLSGDYQQEKERVYDFFFKHPELQTPVEISKDQHRDLVIRQLTALVRDAGFRPLHALMNEPARYFAMTEAVGHVDLSLAIKLGVNFSLWGGSVMNLGTEKHRIKYFDGIENLTFPGCFAMTELHHGSNVQGIQTTATFDKEKNGFVINTPNEGATKWWIGNAALHGKFATVFARLKLPASSGSEQDMGVHAFIVPIRSMEDHAVMPGVEIRDCGYKVGLNGVDNGALRFSHVFVPRENLLDRFGRVEADGSYSSPLPSPGKRFAATLGELVGGRVGLAYGSVGVLKTVSTIAVRYALLRQQFGPPDQAEISILDYPSHQMKLMPMLASAYAFNFATNRLIRLYAEMKKRRGEEELVSEVHALSAGLKAYITTYTQKAISICRESCGGHGYAAVNRFGSLRNDHDIFQTFEGDNTVLLQQVAAELLKQYKEKFSAGTLAVTWGYLKESMGVYLAQTNPVATHREGEAHLRDSKFHLDAFQYRTAKLLHTAALRLRKHTKKMGSFQAWNKCLNHLLTLAESHMESVILFNFISAVESCKNKHDKKILKTLCDLYALDRLWKDIGTYRNEDYVAPNKAKAIHRLVEQLCAEVKDMAVEVVDGFYIPDPLLKAPIGLQHKQYSEYSHFIGF